MIILGNPEFAVGMRLAGVKNSYVIRNREEALEILKRIDKNDFIIANLSVIELVPELMEFRNVVSVPDNVREFFKTDDLTDIIKSAVGIELNV